MIIFCNKHFSLYFCYDNHVTYIFEKKPAKLSIVYGKLYPKIQAKEIENAVKRIEPKNAYELYTGIDISPFNADALDVIIEFVDERSGITFKIQPCSGNSTTTVRVRRHNFFEYYSL